MAMTERWATRHRPIYGSEDTANNMRDIFSTSLKIEALLTALATPSGKDPKEWALAKAKGLVVEWGAVWATSETTGLLKNTTDRTRPDGSDKESFPSASTSQAFSYATLSNRNLESIDIPSGLRVPIQVSNIVMATGVAWQRLENNKHFPSDIIAGAAIGNFLTAFVHDAFLGLPEDSRFGFVILPLKSGVITDLRFAF